MKALNVLLSAYACRPNMGSEPGVGWNTACEVANYEQVWVITRADNRSFIEAEMAANPRDKLQFIYCDIPWLMRWWCKPGQLLHYYFWQIVAYVTVRRLYQNLALDLVHHVTYVRYSTPSFLALLPIPLIWGAVGGGETAPAPFWQDFSWRGKLYEVARRLAHRVGELDPFTRMTVRRSALVRATTAATAERLRAIGATHPEVFPESALATAEIQALAQYPEPPHAPIRFISMARLLHWKGLHLGIQGFAQANLPASSEYWIFGEGPELDELTTLAQTLGVANRVKFWGRQPRLTTLQHLSQCHVLVHPSLHDSGGWVCVEAMAMGRPIICLDLGGPAEQVTAETGVLIAAQYPEQVVADLAKAFQHLALNAPLRRQMGLAGQARAQTVYSWESRGQHLADLYRNIVSRNCSTPNPSACSIAD